MRVSSMRPFLEYKAEVAALIREFKLAVVEASTEIFAKSNCFFSPKDPVRLPSGMLHEVTDSKMPAHPLSPKFTGSLLEPK
jgi:hypothetical protein